MSKAGCPGRGDEIRFLTRRLRALSGREFGGYGMAVEVTTARGQLLAGVFLRSLEPKMTPAGRIYVEFGGSMPDGTAFTRRLRSMRDMVFAHWPQSLRRNFRRVMAADIDAQVAGLNATAPRTTVTRLDP